MTALSLSKQVGVTRALAAGVVLLLTGCGTFGTWLQGQVIGENRAAYALLGAGKAAASTAPIGPEEERAYGGAIAIKIVEKYGGLVDNDELTRYVSLVGNSVAAFSTRPMVQYHFGVLDSEDVNAVSAPGGYVFITIGALRMMKSEAELAGVLAHEVAHIAAKHALTIIKNLKAKSAAVGAAASSINNADFFKNIINAFLDDYLSRGMPRDTEFEADKIGTGLLVETGYHSAGLRDFLSRIAKPDAKHADDAFYNTHPDTSERVAAIDKQLAGPGVHGQRNVERMQARLKLPRGKAKKNALDLNTFLSDKPGNASSAPAQAPAPK